MNDNKQRAAYGLAAMQAGSPDRGEQEERSDAIDAITNILHYLGSVGEDDPTAILSTAASHYLTESDKDAMRRYGYTAVVSVHAKSREEADQMAADLCAATERMDTGTVSLEDSEPEEEEI